MPIQIQLRGGTAAAWTSANPVLADREPGVETDTGKFKIGDGSTAWNSLSYAIANDGATGPQGPPGVSIPPDDPEEPIPIPGPPGADGAAGSSGIGYAMPFGVNTFSPGDGATYYIGNLPVVNITTTEGAFNIYVPKDGTVKSAWVQTWCNGAVGSNENWSMYIRKNAASEELIQTLGAATQSRVWSNTGMSLAVSAGDALQLKMVCPTWATNPTNVWLSALVYIE